MWINIPHPYHFSWFVVYEWVISGGTNYEALHYVVLSCPPLLHHPSYFPQHPILENPAAHVRPSFWTTKFHTHMKQQRIPVAARYTAWVRVRSLAEIVGSNSAGGIYVSLLSLLCVARYRSLRRADHSWRGVLPSVWCVWVWSLSPVRVGDGPDSGRITKKGEEK